MMINNEKNVSETQKNRNYAWLSLLLAFSIFPIIFLAGPLLSSPSQENDIPIYVGLTIGILVIILQITGFVFGMIGLIRAKGPGGIISGLGALVCFLFCLMVLGKLFK